MSGCARVSFVPRIWHVTTTRPDQMDMGWSITFTEAPRGEGLDDWMTSVWCCVTGAFVAGAELLAGPGLGSRMEPLVRSRGVYRGLIRLSVH